ncbi:uncharacterized protein ARMOST_12924 [Armillaria ostoyae]|uniref:Uncharacterized protein n=1 Tax=Armillaria ostoyae TaxID=47428 RepID=A0A284RLB5_ARMOS|nr:uncharacterized protein ARMOST_12924 [Armillaria ostoyae]
MHQKTHRGSMGMDIGIWNGLVSRSFGLVVSTMPERNRSLDNGEGSGKQSTQSTDCRDDTACGTKPERKRRSFDSREGNGKQSTQSTDCRDDSMYSPEGGRAFDHTHATFDLLSHLDTSIPRILNETLNLLSLVP